MTPPPKSTAVKVAEFIEGLSNTVNVPRKYAADTLQMISDEASELLGELRAKATKESYEEEIRVAINKAFVAEIDLMEIIGTLLHAYECAVLYGHGIRSKPDRVAARPLMAAHSVRVARATRDFVLALSTQQVTRGKPPLIQHEGTTDGLSSSN